MLPAKFGSIWPSSFREEDFFNISQWKPILAPFGQVVSEEKIFLTLANQKQELPLVAIFVGGMGQK